MFMRVFRPCIIACCIFPEALFRIRTSEKVLCLTFDDGPDPESTPQLLDILGKHNIKALFFCRGRAAEQYPYLVDLIKSKGHLIGNHGFEHLDGWLTPGEIYIADIAKATPITSCSLFRPPYGRLCINQYRKLKKTFKVFFWDIMPYDYDPDFGSRNSLKVLKQKVRRGSVICLHDTKKSSAKEFLNEFIDFSVSSGYRFVLPQIS